MKTKFEKSDVSRFRMYVRRKRFNQPKYKDNLISLLTRLDIGNEPPINLVVAKSDQKAVSESIDVVGIGKTDFAYFSTNFIRECSEKTIVLTFPDILSQILSGTSFYDSVFVPEVLRLTQSVPDKFNDLLRNIWVIGKSVVQRLFLLIRVNVILLTFTKID
jgi:hypothetical protein